MKQPSFVRITVMCEHFVQGHSVRLSVSYGSHNKHQVLPYRLQHLPVFFVLHTQHVLCEVESDFFFFNFLTRPAQILGFRSPGRVNLVPWRLEFGSGF